MSEVIERSTIFKNTASGVPWQVFAADENKVQRLANYMNLPEIVARLLVNRGVSIEDAESFLNPKLKNSLPDPFHLRDMDKAVNRIIKAINNNENIYIFGDYDVDGATSSALLKRFFKMVDIDVNIYIPDRMSEGYGPNSNAMQTIKNQGGELVITVDCGAVSFEPLAFASEIGLEVIVVDHHLGGSELPKAVAVVNPNRLDETSKYTNLAAVGVCYLLVIAIARTLPDDRKQNIDLMSLLDLVALGTVCDVMKLTGLNRVLVSQGLKIMARRQNLGLKTLADSAGVDDKMTSYHLGFVLGPRINAGGRVGQSYLGSKLLSTHDVVEAMQITQKLNQYNDERKAIEVLVQEEALMQAVENDEPVMMVASENWHQGVIGIVASRLKEKYNLPTAVISITNGIGKASCRSVNGVDFGAAVANAKAKGLILEGGGHTMAAGFSVAEEKITELKQYFIECFKDGVDAYLNQRSVKLDGILSVASLNEQLVNNVDQLAPFGTGNHTPKFVIANCRVVKIDLVGENHLRCILADNLNRHISVKAMAFRAAESKIGDMLYSSIGKDINIAGQAKLNHWQGRTSVDIMIDDVCIG